MSEVLSATATIYGTYAAAAAYLDEMLGDSYTAWLALDVADRKRTLITATRYLDRQTWVDDYDTFAERDALEAFQLASYELAAMVAEDPAVIAVTDAGSNISGVGAGGAFVNYFNPTSTRYGSATKLPPILQDLIGAYLGATGLTGIGGDGEDGCSRDPFRDCADYDRRDPF